jgi:hypothetical protein
MVAVWKRSIGYHSDTREGKKMEDFVNLEAYETILGD